MQYIKIIILVIAVVLCGTVFAQNAATFDEVNKKSYELYEKQSWKELLQYGKQAINEGQDFTLLRLRMAYASFMLSNFSEAIKHYEVVIKKDSYNSIARYYLWLCRRYLNQTEIANVQVKYLSQEVMDKEKLKPFALNQAGLESSYKTSGVNSRGNAFYNRVSIGIRLGWNVDMQQSVALYNQTISESKLRPVINNNHIPINQVEYYNKITVSVNNSLQVKGAYHYIYTPYNNFIYNNHVGLLGIKYYSSYIDVQADVIVAKLTDTISQQYNLQLGLYPLGNLNIYSFSTVSFKSGTNSSTNFKEVAGFRILKNAWLELNGTFGKFSNLLENDALYAYNAIDKNLIKAGAAIYVSITPKVLVQAGYTYEQRELYNTTQTFNQHSITGGISWKF